MTTCSLPRCTKPAGERRGWCTMHYARWLRHGDPLAGRTNAKPSSPTCAVDGCNKPHMAHGWCMTHYYRWRRTGTTEREPLSYNGVHTALKRSRGPAREHACAHGCGRHATTWAYDHDDPNELRQGHGRNRGMAYSLDLSHYLPLCRPCHEEFDALHRTRS